MVSETGVNTIVHYGVSRNPWPMLNFLIFYFKINMISYTVFHWIFTSYDFEMTVSRFFIKIHGEKNSVS